MLSEETQFQIFRCLHARHQLHHRPCSVVYLTRPVGPTIPVETFAAGLVDVATSVVLDVAVSVPVTGAMGSCRTGRLILTALLGLAELDTPDVEAADYGHRHDLCTLGLPL